MSTTKEQQRFNQIYGKQVAENQIVLASEGKKTSEVRAEFLKLLKEREIPDTIIISIAILI